MPAEPYSDVRPYDHDLWECPDDQASEREVTEFIGALVRAVKPETVVEIGAWKGDTSIEIALQLNFNTRGHLHTFEVNEDRAFDTLRRTLGMSVVTVYGEDANEWDDKRIGEVVGPIDILFIDGHLDNRLDSYQRWGHHVVTGGFILFHDSLKYPEVKRVVDSIGEPKIHLFTPRGLTIVQV